MSDCIKAQLHYISELIEEGYTYDKKTGYLTNSSRIIEIECCPIQSLVSQYLLYNFTVVEEHLHNNGDCELLSELLGILASPIGEKMETANDKLAQMYSKLKDALYDLLSDDIHDYYYNEYEDEKYAIAADRAQYRADDEGVTRD